MDTSAVPLVIDALVDRCRAAFESGDAPDSLVLDGYDDTSSAGNYLMIGVEDPDQDWGQSATAEQDWATIGGESRSEDGDVTCVALAWSGNAEMKDVRDLVYAIHAVVARVCWSDPTLGVPQLQWTTFGTRSNYVQRVNDDGALMGLLTFQIHFKARLTRN